MVEVRVGGNLIRSLAKYVMSKISIHFEHSKKELVDSKLSCIATIQYTSLVHILEDTYHNVQPTRVHYLDDEVHLTTLVVNSFLEIVTDRASNGICLYSNSARIESFDKGMLPFRPVRRFWTVYCVIEDEVGEVILEFLVPDWSWGRICTPWS